jgi:hypothetical protein
MNYVTRQESLTVFDASLGLVIGKQFIPIHSFKILKWYAFVKPLISALNLRSSLWKSRSIPLSWTRELPKSNPMGRKFLSSKFHSGTNVGGEDTMGMGRPSGVSTIIKLTPPVVPCFLLKAQALSDLYCTLQTTFRMILIAKLEHYHHEALN